MISKSKLLMFCLLMMILLNPTYTNAAINSTDLHSRDGKPTLSTKPLEMYKDRECTKKYKKKIKSNEAFRILGIRDGMATMYYGKKLAFIKADELLYGEQLDQFVADNYTLFDKKITLNVDSDIFEIDSNKIIANASKDTAFLIENEDDKFYYVLFDGNSGRIAKENADEEIYVKVVKYGSDVETIASLLINSKKVLEGLSTNEIQQELENRIVEYAVQFEGNPYVWGGTSLTDGTDCSGFTQGIYKHFGVTIPRTSYTQATVGTTVNVNELQPGDLCFYNRGSRIGHVSMYIGNGKIIHARNSKSGIVISDLNRETPVICKRILSDEKLKELRGKF